MILVFSISMSLVVISYMLDMYLQIENLWRKHADSIFMPIKFLKQLSAVLMN